MPERVRESARVKPLDKRNNLGFIKTLNMYIFLPLKWRIARAIDTHARKRYTLTRYYIKSQNKDLLNSLSLSLSLSLCASPSGAHTLHARETKK